MLYNIGPRIIRLRQGTLNEGEGTVQLTSLIG
jgi:hypothetical protein